MKVIGQVMAKNEGLRLDFCVRHLLEYCDHVVVLDNDSADGTAERLRSAYGSSVTILSEPGGLQEKRFRTLMAVTARALGATHGVALDADEVLVRSAIPRIREILAQLKPGDYLIQTWIPLWKSYHAYRVDAPHFPNLRTFMWAFTGDEITFSGRDIFHTSRIPNVPGNGVPTTVEEGILHYAQANWLNHSIKTCWYKAMEYKHGLPLERLAEYDSYFTGGESLVLAPERWLYPDFHQPDWDRLHTWRLRELVDWRARQPEVFARIKFPIDWERLLAS